jgi:hypothetical protein
LVHITTTVAFIVAAPTVAFTKSSIPGTYRINGCRHDRNIRQGLSEPAAVGLCSRGKSVFFAVNRSVAAIV